MIICKITKSQGFTLSLKDGFLEKPQEVSNWHPPSFLGYKIKSVIHKTAHENYINDALFLFIAWHDYVKVCTATAAVSFA